MLFDQPIKISSIVYIDVMETIFLCDQPVTSKIIYTLLDEVSINRALQKSEISISVQFSKHPEREREREREREGKGRKHS